MTRRKERLHILDNLKPYRKSRALLLGIASGLVVSIVMIAGAFAPHSFKLESSFHIEYTTITNIILFTFLYLYNFEVIRYRLARNKTVLLGLIGSLAWGLGFSFFSHWLEGLIYGKDNITDEIVLDIIIYETISLISYLIALLLNNVTRYQEAVVENEHLQNENIIIRYETLERQVGPHFLFNSLNTLNGLIGIDDEKAHTYLQELANTYRYIMQKERIVSLESEMEFTKSYIYLMSVRYGSNLIINQQIDSKLMHHETVPISIQLLVENAVKHNVISQKYPLTINITSTPNNTIAVSNKIQPKSDHEESNGIGLANLAERYKLILNKEIIINQYDGQFTVEIPLA